MELVNVQEVAEVLNLCAQLFHFSMSLFFYTLPEQVLWWVLVKEVINDLG